MPLLLPFRGLRPDPAITGPLSQVACPPYDVVTPQERDRLVAESPYNFVRVEVPAGDYAGAAALLEQWKSSRAWAEDPAPALYGYRMEYRTATGLKRDTVGVMGALVLGPPGQGILPHEQTTPKDKTDRLELIRATKANTSPIWCLCREHGLAELALSCYDKAPVAKAEDDDGVVHEVWPIFDPEVHRQVAELTNAGPLLIADGHHRYETALTYRAEASTATAGGTPVSPEQGTRAATRDERPAAPGTDAAALRSARGLDDRVCHPGPNAVLSLVVELSSEHLYVLAIHRALANLPAGTDLLGLLGKVLSLEPARSTGLAMLEEMNAARAAGIVTPQGAFLARALPGRANPADAEAEELDSVLLDVALAALPPHEVHYEHDAARALAQLNKRKVDAVLLCRPASIAQIAATATGGHRLPPKTTFFWPKPRSGLVVRAW